jgi:16S rRNA G966 N2-methylase RsmD
MKRRGILFTLKLIFWELSFDFIYGIETLSIVGLEDLDISESDKSHSKIYQATNYYLLLHSLNSLQNVGFDFKNKVIIDMGSGKGRVLILFAQRGVKKCIGVEISNSLNLIANQNIQLWKSKNKDCITDFSLVTIDASKYQIPSDVNLIYLSNPFDPYIMKQVIENLKVSYESNPREIFIVYMIPLHEELFDGANFERIFKFQTDYTIYKIK